MGWDRTLSEAVIEAVSTAEGVKPHQLAEPLYTVCDPDALDSLFHGSNGTVSFTYHGYNVIVDETGEVELEPVA